MTVDDLRRRFATLDQVAAPDLRDEIDRRTADLTRRMSVRVEAGRARWRRTTSGSGGLGGARFAGVPVVAILALLLVALVASLSLGAGWWRLSTTLVVPSASAVSPTAVPTRPAPSSAPSIAPRRATVVYVVCGSALTPAGDCDADDRLWVMHGDGTGARELRPDEPGSQFLLDRSADGSRILYTSASLGDNLGFTDTSGSAPELLAIDSLCPGDRPGCWPSTGHIALSPDGSRLAYTIFTETAKPDPACGTDGLFCRLRDGTIAVLDRASGNVTALETSRLPGLFRCCDGYYAPTWSPDGTRLAFALWPLTSYVIDADGSNLRHLEGSGTAPQWSPDGSTIASVICGSNPTLYFFRPDGRSVRNLQFDGCDFSWTLDGRITYGGYSPDPSAPSDMWVMDEDGGNLQRLGDSVSALTEVGCVICPLPPAVGPVIGNGFWRPAQEDLQ
jgi:Tol biopolymer transport system component